VGGQGEREGALVHRLADTAVTGRATRRRGLARMLGT
jgi:hypothetical protein